MGSHQCKIQRDEDGELDVSELQSEVATYSHEQIVAFDRIMRGLMQKSYTTNLIGAASIINGGTTDDGFDYFRGWLIGMGRTVFERTLADPDSLASVVDDEVECSDILYVAISAYEQASDGQELPVSDGEGDPGDDDAWDYNDEEKLRTRLPALFSKFAE